MWKLVALISQAEAVLSTSLHVRIIALLYMRPRLTWCGHEPKTPWYRNLKLAEQSAHHVLVSKNLLKAFIRQGHDQLCK